MLYHYAKDQDPKCGEKSIDPGENFFHFSEKLEQ